ncbi:LamG-like jellyroll fold domain-containing protein [Flavobacterium sp. U410]|jgi:hypothetical protein
MKKILLFLVLTSLNLVAQTPIWHYTFDGNSSPVNPQGNYGGSLFKVSGGTTNASNFGMDRFGNPESSLRVENDGSGNFLYYTNLANLPQGNNPRTFSFWVRYKNTGDKRIFLYGGNTNDNMYGMSVGTSTIIQYINTSLSQSTQFVNSDYPHYVSLNSADSDAWIHYTVTSNSSETKIYKNGVLLDTHAITLTTYGTNLKFGLPNLDDNTPVAGSFLLDDFKIYDQVLTNSQIKQLYADAMAFDATDLVAYYGFDGNLNCANNAQYNLTASNPADNYYVTGVIGQAREFTSNAAYNDILGQVIDNNEFTIMVWEKRNAAQSSTDYATIFELGGSLYARRRQSNFKTGYADSPTTWVGEGSTIENPYNQWVHHTITVKNNGGYFNAVYYRNGELLSQTVSSSTSFHMFFNKFVFGGGIDGNGVLHSGKYIKYVNLDEAYIYNRILSQPEILATMYRTTLPSVLSSANFELKEISLYPNPTNSMFTVEVPNDTVKTVSVVDVMGKVVVTSNVTTVDVSNLASGIYIVKVETVSGKIGVQKLIRK